MAFDAKGRLWVTTMESYPMYLPGTPVNDKVLILEDTDGDGKADKQTVFADGLQVPGGIELGDGGAYVAQQPNLMFIKDTDGDDMADEYHYRLHGFDSADSHHAISAFTWGPGGALYFQEGTFHQTQVETPYGPVRDQRRRRLPLRAADREARHLRLLRLRQPLGPHLRPLGPELRRRRLGRRQLLRDRLLGRRRLPAQALVDAAVPRQAVAADLRLRRWSPAATSRTRRRATTC